MRVCPLCLGKGEIQEYYTHARVNNLKAEILKLRKQGLSMRQIANAVGLKSPNTVYYHLSNPLRSK